ncbi:RluA family pseudouridine synthase [Hydrogenimonas sp. SS33]|uniref:RluA family pseudouridine synthase n=1 Tax=Hydrogenimonas leucolamina TaxID=2954236 RepID=UPI00336BFF80
MAFVDTHYRLDEPMPAFLFLMRKVGVKQNEAQKIVATGRLKVNGEVMTESGAIISGEISVKTFIPQPKGEKPIFTTPDFALFDKPSGTLVHPTTHRTPYSLLDDIRYIFGKQANALHRIDMETSGLLMVSRNKKAERELKTKFETKDVKKSYLAWVRGRIDKPFSVDVPLKQNTDFSTIKLKMLVHPEGKPSLTEFVPIEYDEEHDATLVKAIPHTGRQHQIRVHLFHVKHPILGDPIYGVPMDVAIRYLDKVLSEKERLYYMGARRLLLHAQSLVFEYRGVHYRLESKFDFEEVKKEIVLPQKRHKPVY